VDCIALASGLQFSGNCDARQNPRKDNDLEGTYFSVWNEVSGTTRIPCPYAVLCLRPTFMTTSKTPEPVEVCWRVVEGSTTRMLTCAIFGASAHGVELRLGYFVDVPLHSRTMHDIESARLLAKDWLYAVRSAARGHRVELQP
jgi:hypothetical protein